MFLSCVSLLAAEGATSREPVRHRRCCHAKISRRKAAGYKILSREVRLGWVALLVGVGRWRRVERSGVPLALLPRKNIDALFGRLLKVDLQNVSEPGRFVCWGWEHVARCDAPLVLPARKNIAAVGGWLQNGDSKSGPEPSHFFGWRVVWGGGDHVEGSGVPLVSLSSENIVAARS